MTANSTGDNLVTDDSEIQETHTQALAINITKRVQEQV